MIRFRPTSTTIKTAALALGAFLGLGTSAAHAQVAAAAPTYGPRAFVPATGRVNYGGVYYGSNFYGPGGYFGGTTNGYNPGRVGPGPVRDWSTGRNVPLAKPWMRPLPR